MDGISEGRVQGEQLAARATARAAALQKGVSYRALVALAAASGCGAVVAFLVLNAAESEHIAFSTVSLVTFVFSVAVASGSIVLSVTAIALGKASEQAMIQRSDESIRLQNEIFVKTTDALQRIESSTGVTEKRIEDIISGRVGDISQRVAERAVSDKLITGPMRDQLEEEIQKSIMAEVLALPGMQTRRRELEEANERQAREDYSRFRDAVFLALANSPGVTAEKMGEGYYRRSGVDLVDGVFVVEGLRVAVATFSTHPALEHRFAPGFAEFVPDLAREISEGTFHLGFLVIDEQPSDDHVYSTKFRLAKHLMRSEVADRLFMLSGSATEAVRAILEAVETADAGP